MSVKVVDAIMGTGKSQSAITYINEHPERRFIYITPYLDEASRIKKGCRNANFVEPSANIAEFEFKKSTHTAFLIKEGRNITTTHQAFKGYTAETLEDIRRMEYTLIIDENVDVLEKFEFHPDDLKMAVDAGYISDKDGVYSIVNHDYHGRALSEMFRLLRSRELVRTSSDSDGDIFYWALPPELITSFKDVFILTYLFDGQSLHHFLNIYNIPYEHIGIHRDEDGGYRFGELPGYVPEYVPHLKDMLHILDNPKLNEVGDDYHALSMSWYKRGGEKVDQLKNNVYNTFNNIWGDIPSDRRLWGAYNGEFTKIRGKGYTKAFLTFNAKATNKYGDRDCLVYISNLFMNVNEKKFYQAHGIDVDEDRYALSIMVQWIWRSAIRNGKEVSLYIPSRRMREMLIKWIDETSKGGACNESTM